MQKTVSFNEDIVAQIERLQTSYTFSEFCQMAVRETLERKKLELAHMIDLSHKTIEQLTLNQIQAKSQESQSWIQETQKNLKPKIWENPSITSLPLAHVTKDIG